MRFPGFLDIYRDLWNYSRFMRFFVISEDFCDFCSVTSVCAVFIPALGFFLFFFFSIFIFSKARGGEKIKTVGGSLWWCIELCPRFHDSFSFILSTCTCCYMFLLLFSVFSLHKVIYLNTNCLLFSDSNCSCYFQTQRRYFLSILITLIALWCQISSIVLF